MSIDCIACFEENLNKNTIGINKKLLGTDVKSFYCMSCLADYLNTSVIDFPEILIYP